LDAPFRFAAIQAGFGQPNIEGETKIESRLQVDQTIFFAQMLVVFCQLELVCHYVALVLSTNAIMNG